MERWIVVLLVGLLAGCSLYSDVPELPRDQALDANGAEPDVGQDAAVDAAPDAAVDAAVDAGPVATVSFDPESVSSWAIAPTIFGRFQEHNGRDIYPGLYAQHISNGSFEDWYVLPGGDNVRTEELYRDEPTFEHIAYPWRPKSLRQPGAPDGSGQPSWERLEGGVNGRSDTSHFQRIYTNTQHYHGGIRQLVALPDQRTVEYVARLHVRSSSASEVKVRLEKPGGETYAEATIPLTDEWAFHRVELSMSRINPVRYFGKSGTEQPPWGEYQLAILLEEKGHVDVDMVVLMSGDAVEGKFNPTTIDNLEQMGVTSMRWPGGNFTSGYHWRDGIGPLYQRPVRPNRSWGGLEPNYMGTDEYLAFCEQAGLEPFINVGFSNDITPQDAADWVEYVNGDQSTPMGQLRAQHGHPDPYGVELWQVGNEVYGEYQIGHTDAANYANRVRQYIDAMKAVDPAITVIAAGIDPYYFDYRGNHWNEVLIQDAGDVIDGVDIHRYVNGWRSEAGRADVDPWDYQQMLVAFPSQFEQILGVLRDTATDNGHDDMWINVGEWNLQPQVNTGWPRAGYPTMAHASFVAGMYNTFIRQGDMVRLAFQRDNTLYFRAYPIDTRPVGPNNFVTQLYEAPFDEPATYRQLPVELDAETFVLEQMSPRMKEQPDVAYVDAAGIISELGTQGYIFVTNRDLRRTHTVTLAPSQAPVGGEVDLVMLQAEGPFVAQTSWETQDGFTIARRTVSVDADGQVVVEMPPASVARIEVRW